MPLFQTLHTSGQAWTCSLYYTCVHIWYIYIVHIWVTGGLSSFSFPSLWSQHSGRRCPVSELKGRQYLRAPECASRRAEDSLELCSTWAAVAWWKGVTTERRGNEKLPPCTTFVCPERSAGKVPLCSRAELCHFWPPDTPVPRCLTQ